jgi:hypothetical protein
MLTRSQPENTIRPSRHGPLRRTTLRRRRATQGSAHGASARGAGRSRGKETPRRKSLLTWRSVSLSHYTREPTPAPAPGRTRRPARAWRSGGARRTAVHRRAGRAAAGPGVQPDAHGRRPHLPPGRPVSGRRPLPPPPRERLRPPRKPLPSEAEARTPAKLRPPRAFGWLLGCSRISFGRSQLTHLLSAPDMAELIAAILPGRPPSAPIAFHHNNIRTRSTVPARIHSADASPSFAASVGRLARRRGASQCCRRSR